MTGQPQEPLFGDRTVRGFAGGTGWHAHLATELTLLVAPVEHPCRTYGSDMRIEMVRSSVRRSRSGRRRALEEFLTIDSHDAIGIPRLG